MQIYKRIFIKVFAPRHSVHRTFICYKRVASCRFNRQEPQQIIGAHSIHIARSTAFPVISNDQLSTMSRGLITMPDDFVISEGDFASDWSDAKPDVQQEVAPAKPASDLAGLVDDLPSDIWEASQEPLPNIFPNSSPPRLETKSTLTEQELDALVDDPEWGFDDTPLPKAPMEIELESGDFVSSFSDRPGQIEPVKAEKIDTFDEFSDWSEVETKLEQGLKRSLESPNKTSPKAQKTSSAHSIGNKENSALTASLGVSKTARQSKLTAFISPLIQKAHASTLAADTKMMTSRDKGVIAPIFLTEEQRRILSMVVDEQRNIFFTGAAGTGKSVLLRRIISELRKKYRKKQNQPVAVTASTGLAACNIGGMTLHSFGGIGLGEEPVARLVEKIRKNRKANRRWKDTKVLVIDEISMIDGGLFDKLEQISRIINKNDEPFGGIQLVITGDFFQLPPVFKASKVPNVFGGAGSGFQTKDSFLDEPETEGKFSFDADSWKSVVTTTVELRQVFRQKDDRFSNMLNSIRRGEVTDEMERAFQVLSRTPQVPGDITPTELYPLRRDVDNANRQKMRQLAGRVVEFKAQDSYMSDYAENLNKLDLLMCPKELSVKRGAQVMLIKNLDETLVNGSLGKVVGFMSESSFKLVKELPVAQAEKVVKGSMSAEEAVEEFLEEASRKKEYQFDDIDEGVISELMKMEESRLGENPTSKEEIKKERKVAHGFTSSPECEDDPFEILDVSQEMVEQDPHGVNWKRKQALIKLMNKTGDTMGQKWPYVRFLLQDGTTRDVLVQPETWTLEDPEGKPEASRSQVPLILAWALSIHKSQGQTLEWVKVDLSHVFESGQAYVALSRAVRMEGLQVLGFSKGKIRVNPKVIDFYAGLVSALEVSKQHKKEAEDVEVIKKQGTRKSTRRKLAG